MRNHRPRRVAWLLPALAVALTATPATALAAQGDLIVTNFPGYVLRMDQSGLRTMVSGNAAPSQNGDADLGDLRAVAIGPDGDLFVADAGGFGSSFGTIGGVWRIDPVTGVRSVVSSNDAPVGTADTDFFNPNGIAFADDGSLIVTDYRGGTAGERVLRVNPDTGERTLIANNTNPTLDGEDFVQIETSIALTPDGTLYIADSDAFDGGGGVFRVDPVTGTRTMVTNNSFPANGAVPDFDTPVAVAFDGDGNLLVVDRRDERDFDGAVIRVDPATGTRTLVSDNDEPDQDDPTDFINPSGIAIAPNDDILVTKDPFEIESEHTGVTRVNPLTGAREAFSDNLAPIAGTDGNGAWGIAIDSTPHIASSFVAPNVPLADPARLRLTVTGLRYAVGGRDWSLTNALPAGLAVAPAPNVAIACQDAAGAPTVPSAINVTAPAGAAAIDVSGSLKRLDASCSVEVDVVASAGAGTYVTGPGNVTAREGLDPPGPAISPVTFHAPPRVSLERPSGGLVVDQGSPLQASFECSASAGVQSCTGSSANGASLDTSVPGTYSYSATVVDKVGQSATKTASYTVKAPASVTVPVRQPKTGAQLALECSGQRIALLEVVQVGSRVRFKGVTARANAGRLVPIRLLDGTRVVRARVQPNGLFEITGPLPKSSIRETEKARYVAELGGVRSASVKLTRRMTMDALNLSRTSVTIYGQISKPLPKVKRDIVITERTSCSRAARVVATVRPNRSGVYRATFRRPPGVDSAIYRLRSRVRVESTGKKETFRTYTLVRAVDLF